VVELILYIVQKICKYVSVHLVVAVTVLYTCNWTGLMGQNQTVFETA